MEKIKFLQTLDLDTHKLLTSIAEKRGITVQTLIRVIIINDWLEPRNKIPNVQNVPSSKHVPTIKNEHVLFRPKNNSEYIQKLLTYIKNAVDNNYLCVLFFPQTEMNVKLKLLLKHNISASYMLNNFVLLAQDVDNWKESPSTIVCDIYKMLSMLILQKQKHGVCVIGGCANYLWKNGKKSLSIELERSWQTLIQNSTFPINVLCPHEHRFQHKDVVSFTQIHTSTI